MGNYLSKPADFGNYTQAINLDLVSFVMQSRQQKYDYNLAKLENKISQELGSIDLVRSEDKKYFLERANEAISSAGDISQLDFSSNGVARELDSRINSIVDDRVLNDVVSTSNYRTFQNTIQQKQKESPELYSATNVAYAMSKYGVNDWLNGDSDDLGSISYNDFYDYQGEVEEIEDNLERYVDVQKVTTSDGNGHYYIDSTQERLTEDKIRDIVRSKLSDKAKKQIQIESWAAYGSGRFSYSDAVNNYKNYIGVDSENPNGKLVGSYDRYIAEQKLKLNKIQDKTSSQAKEVKAEIARYEKAKENTLKSQNRFLNAEESKQEWAMDNMAYMIFENDLVDSVAKRNAFNRVTDIDRTKTFQYEVDLVNYKSRVEAESKGTLGQGSGSRFAIKDEQLNDVNSYEGLINDIDKYSSGFTQNVNEAMNYLTSDMKANIEATYDPSLGKTKEEHYYDMLQEQGLQNLSAEAVGALKEADRNKKISNKLQKDYSDAIKYSFEKLESGVGVSGGMKNLIDEIYSNQGIRMTDLDGTVMTARDYFKKYGINEDNAEDLNDPKNAEIKNHFLKNYYADMIASYEQPGVRRGIAEWLQSKGISSFGSSPEENDQIIAQMRLEEVSEANLYKQRLQDLFNGDNAKTTAFIENAKSKGLHGQRINWGLHFIDRSFKDDSTTKSYIGISEIEKGVTEFLNDRYRGGRNLGITFSNQSGEGADLINVLSNPDINVGELARLKSTKSDNFAINVIPAGPDEVIIRTTDKEGEVLQGVVLRRELPQSILDKVDFNMEQQYDIYTPESMETMSQKVSYSDEGAVRHAKNVSNFVVGDLDTARLVSKDQSLNVLASTYIDLLGSDSQPTPLRTGLDKAMEDGALEYKLEKVEGEFFRQLVLNMDGEKVTLFSDNEWNAVPDDLLEQQYNLVKYAPQIGAHFILDSLLQQYLMDTNNPRKGIKKLIEYGIK